MTLTGVGLVISYTVMPKLKDLYKEEVAHKQ